LAHPKALDFPAVDDGLDLSDRRNPRRAVTTDQLKVFLSARPFSPFLIHTADGRSIEVRHPETVAHGGGRVAVGVKSDDSFEVVDLSLVPSLEALPVSRGG
jgi:hypothetical protein